MICERHRILHAEVQAWLDVGHFMQRAVLLTARKHEATAREVMTAYFIVRNDEGTNRYKYEDLDRLHDAIHGTNVVSLAEARRRRARRREKVLQ